MLAASKVVCLRVLKLQGKRLLGMLTADMMLLDVMVRLLG